MSVASFRKFAQDHNISINIVENSETTKTAEEAAKFHNVEVDQIVKSLLLKAGDIFLLYLTPGNTRLDIEAIKQELGFNTLRMANADEVKEITGYSIGGVPPFGHKNPIKTYIHSGFRENVPLFAAAGSHLATFETNLNQLNNLVFK